MSITPLASLTAIDILPEYVKFHNDLQGVINNPPKLETSVLIQATEAVSTAAAKSESALLDEIKGMSGAADSVDQSFRSVSKLFIEVRSSSSSAPVKADMQVLENRWNTYHNTFTNLVWQSRAVAGKAQAAADDFARDFIVFLSDDSESIDSKKNEIKNYIKELDRDAKSAETVSQGFVDLQKNLLDFVNDWKALCIKYDIKGKVEKVETLRALLEQLNRTILDLNLKIAELTAKLNVSSPFYGVFGIFQIVSPGFWFGVVAATFGHLALVLDLQKANIEKTVVNAKYATTMTQYIAALAELMQVQALQNTLDKAQNDITNVCDKIGSFAKIWAMIRTDLQRISETLDYVVGTDSERLFKSRLTSTAKLYALLGKALYQYQNSVTSAHPIFATRTQ